MIDEILSDVREINERLLSGSLFYDTFEGQNDSKYFFRNLEHFGFDPDHIVVLSLTPDGDDTVIGRFMTKEGDVYRFDFDLDDCEYSRLSNVSTQEKPDNAVGLQKMEHLEEAAGRLLLSERP